ncbi:MAG TPA: hypothetical protein PKC13_17235 [Blastocatellia bacterium]|nr:hypothetical protein [Blastocatellia bacterium]HMY71416.1 hypothetical protein [Blastocatellia bacterium]
MINAGNQMVCQSRPGQTGSLSAVFKFDETVIASESLGVNCWRQQFRRADSHNACKSFEVVAAADCSTSMVVI